jgi:hypothetical protein
MLSVILSIKDMGVHGLHLGRGLLRVALPRDGRSSDGETWTGLKCKWLEEETVS